MRFNLRASIMSLVAAAGFAQAALAADLTQSSAYRQTASFHAEPGFASNPDSAWRAYKDRFILPEGRLQDIDNGRISHSEGQGYGMLLAVLNGDRETFERMWTWTSENLFVRGDNLAAWRWRAGLGVTDRNNATDGDLLIAWALARAGREWNDEGHLEDARQIAFATARLVRYSPAYGFVLPPGQKGFDESSMRDGPVVNLSYAVLPAFDELAKVAPEIDWESLRASSVALMKRSQFGKAGLPSDWVSLSHAEPTPAAFKPGVFGYDAIRIPLYLAWSKTSEPAVIDIFGRGWKQLQDLRPAVIDVANNREVEPFWSSSYRAVVALTRCAAYGEAFPEQLSKVDLGHYYPATLHMLSLAALRERHPECQSAIAMRM